ncbi:ATP-binding protein [Geobacter sp.]|uniref:ATP-binding protein n=1 Tax=Geobacter sp. TaxID=46610 RepID=UPI0026238063|nr:ATP-binding protein [Geobacter sp.]
MTARLTIRNKIFLSIFLILLVSYAILIHTTARTIDGFLERYLSKELNANLLFARDQYLARGNEIRVSLMHPASAPPVRERFERRDLPWLRDAGRRWHAILPHVEMFTFVDPTLQVIARWGSSRSDDRFSLVPIVERAYRERRPVVATELVTRRFLCAEGVERECRGTRETEQKLMITVVVPVLKGDGRPAGAIVAGDIIDNDETIQARVQDLFGKQVVVAVARGGETAPRNREGAVPFPSSLSPEVAARLARGEPYRGDATIGGIRYKTAFEPLTNSRGEYVGALYLALSRHDFQGIMRESLGNIVTSAVLGFILSFITAYLVARRLTTPLSELATGVRKIEGGDLRQRVAVTSADEVGELAEAFNRMARTLDERDRTIRTKAHDLEELNGKLREMNELLERRVAERTAALRVEMERLEAILIGMAEGIAVTDREGRIILFNPAAQQLFEMVPHRVVGKTVEQLCGGGEFCRLVDYIDSMREHSDAAPRRDVALAVKGKQLRVNLSPLSDEGGGFAGVVMSVRDVTAEEEVGRMKTEFISTVSHELKTPLTSIKGSLQLILDKGKGFTEVEGELLAICLRNTDRLIRLVNDILDIAKIESGRMEFARSRQSVRELVTVAVQELAGYAREHGITVVNAAGDDLPPVFCDRDRLGQVLTNLLSNAVKFSPRGSVVTITAERSDNFVAVSVADRGREIQWSDRGKLFKKFQQLDNSDRRQHGGTGLGLAICKEIVERHHGRIFYTEGIGGGNVFTFTIPVHEEQ